MERSNASLLSCGNLVRMIRRPVRGGGRDCLGWARSPGRSEAAKRQYGLRRHVISQELLDHLFAGRDPNRVLAP
jgi:hypothetical protein